MKPLLYTLAVMVTAGQALECSAAMFIPLGDLPGGAFQSFGSSVSADGSTAIGSSTDNIFSSTPQAVQWTVQTGIVSLGKNVELNHSRSLSKGVSANGEYIVGYSSSDGSLVAYRWSAASGMLPLDGLAERGISSSVAHDVSADGSVVVGLAHLRGDLDPTVAPRAFLWTEAGGISFLGTLPNGRDSSAGHGVSADGRFVVGNAAGQFGFEAFLWSQGSGMQGLGDLPGGGFLSTARGISDDGSVIIGTSASELSRGSSEAFRWTAGSGMIGLGDLPGGDHSSGANDLTADGTTIVGGSLSADGPRAVIWRNSIVPESLQDILINEFGLAGSLQGWQLTAAHGISADGRVIVGTGINPDGNNEGWIVQLNPIPEPSSLMMATFGTGVIAVVRLARQRKSLGAKLAPT